MKRNLSQQELRAKYALYLSLMRTFQTAKGDGSDFLRCLDDEQFLAFLEMLDFLDGQDGASFRTAVQAPDKQADLKKLLPPETYAALRAIPEADHKDFFAYLDRRTDLDVQPGVLYLWNGAATEILSGIVIGAGASLLARSALTAVVGPSVLPVAAVSAFGGAAAGGAVAFYRTRKENAYRAAQEKDYFEKTGRSLRVDMMARFVALGQEHRQAEIILAKKADETTDAAAKKALENDLRDMKKKNEGLEKKQQALIEKTTGRKDPLRAVARGAALGAVFAAGGFFAMEGLMGALAPVTPAAEVPPAGVTYITYETNNITNETNNIINVYPRGSTYCCNRPSVFSFGGRDFFSSGRGCGSNPYYGGYEVYRVPGHYHYGDSGYYRDYSRPSRYPNIFHADGSQTGSRYGDSFWYRNRPYFWRFFNPGRGITCCPR